VIFLTACSASTQPVVKIGLVAPFEGRYRPIGYEAIYAARLAIREINAQEKLVLLQSFSSAQGDATRHPMAPVWPLFTRSTTTLTEQDGGTLLTLEWAPHEASDAEQAVFAASHASLNQGWSGTFEQLESYLSLLQTP